MSLPPYRNTFGYTVQAAYEKVGLVPDGQPCNSAQIAKGMNLLNDICFYWCTKGLKLFTVEDIAVPLTATNFYPMGPGYTVNIVPKPERIDFAYYLDQSGNRVPMTAVSQQEWTVLPIESSSAGTPVNYFVDKQTLFLGVYVWPTPDTTAQAGMLHLVTRKALTPGELYTTATGFPPEWQLPLQWFLAEELSVGQPAPIIQMCVAKAKTAREDVEGWDVEDAQVFLTPDTRGMYSGSDFS